MYPDARLRSGPGARRFAAILVAFIAAPIVILINAPGAQADNTRLNNGVFTNIFTAQKLNGCQSEPRWAPQLVEAARVHTFDVLNHPEINGDIGSDGSNPQDRARAVGFRGTASQTVAVNPALAISGMEILEQWWYNPVARATMQDCRNTAIGVWSENSLSRSVVVAVYGQPEV